MSEVKKKKITIKHLLGMKTRGELITALGVYDYPTASVADQLGFEILFTGPSGPMSLFGHRHVRSIKPEEMLVITKAVSRVDPKALLVASLPFMSYESSNQRAIETAALFVTQGGADCVKCDANRYLAPRLKAIVRSGIPVMAHIGLQASRYVEQSGYRVQGRTAAEAINLVEDAEALVNAGVFALLVETATLEVTRYLKDRLHVPVISLGSGSDADGVCIVSGDAVGYSAFPKPPTAASFVDIRPSIHKALTNYAQSARNGLYPVEGQYASLPPDKWQKIKKVLVS